MLFRSVDVKGSGWQIKNNKCYTPRLDGFQSHNISCTGCTGSGTGNTYDGNFTSVTASGGKCINMQSCSNNTIKCTNTVTGGSVSNCTCQ